MTVRPGDRAHRSAALNGAGSTFQAPLVSEWASRFKDSSGTTVNYQPVGSGAGIAQLTAGTVDFAGSDAVMKPEEVAAGRDKGTPVHLPIALGAVTVSYNLDGVRAGSETRRPDDRRHLPRQSHEVERPEIASLNAGVDLPDTDITVCHRSDESGTTANFTQFLADYSRAWADGPGVDKSVQWPVGTGAKRQRRRRRLRQADPGRGRLRRAGVRAAERLHDRGREEQRRPVGRADARRHLGRRRGREPARQPAVLDDQRGGREKLPDHRGDLPDRLAGPLQEPASPRTRREA